MIILSVKSLYVLSPPATSGCDDAEIICWLSRSHYKHVMMSAMASQFTSLMIIYSTVYWGTYQRKIKSLRHWPLCGELTGDRWIPAQRASNTEDVSIWWRHHVVLKMTTVHSKANAKMNTYINTFRVIRLCEHLLSLLTYPGLIKYCSVKLLLKGIDQGTDWSIALKKIYFTECLQHAELLLWRNYSLSYFTTDYCKILHYFNTMFVIHLTDRVPESPWHVVYLNIDATPKNFTKELLFQHDMLLAFQHPMLSNHAKLSQITKNCWTKGVKRLLLTFVSEYIHWNAWLCGITVISH